MPSYLCLQSRLHFSKTLRCLVFVSNLSQNRFKPSPKHSQLPNLRFGLSHHCFKPPLKILRVRPSHLIHLYYSPALHIHSTYPFNSLSNCCCLLSFKNSCLFSTLSLSLANSLEIRKGKRVSKEPAYCSVTVPQHRGCK